MLIFKMADVSHVVFHVRLWWTTHDVPLMDWVSLSYFGLIGCLVWEISQFLDFGNLAWKCLFAPLMGGFWGTFPPNNVIYHSNSKRTVLGPNYVIWVIKREYRPHGSSWALEEEKKDSTGQEKGHKRVIFHLFGGSPHSSDLHQKLCSR